jgi:hypothetical protein
MMITSIKTLEHTVIRTHTHTNVYHWARSIDGLINHTNLRSASKRYRTGQHNFTSITGRYYALWRSLLRSLYTGHSVSGTIGSISGSPVTWYCSDSISAVTPNHRTLDWILIFGKRIKSLNRRNKVSVLCIVILHTSRFCLCSSFVIQQELCSSPSHV